MNEVIVNDVRKGLYLDSVALMRMSRAISNMDGVIEAAMMMGTPSNLEIMADAQLLADNGKIAAGGDLVVGVRATNQAAASAALDYAEIQLKKPMQAGEKTKEWRPKTLRAAIKVEPKTNLALISVPGDFAVAEARKAIRRGLNAMIFSDNVALSEEATLKREARELGRLVMGPDCGTAIINGTPLAFANAVPRGKTGIVGASGTGTQEISSLIAQYGGGISHAIGVGGRDLKSEVGGISTLMAIDALEADTMTEQILLVSKPPPKEVADAVLARISRSGKPAIICFIGANELPMPGNVRQVATLKEAARMAVDLPDGEPAVLETEIEIASGGKLIKGLFSGGTLCAETQVLFCAAGRAVCSNAPIPGVSSLEVANKGHPLLDLGDDQYTRGKPHPMIDPSVRDDLIVEALNDATVGLVLADVVIGYGAHADPAGHLAGVIAANAREGTPPIIASVTGTEEDPQVRSRQVAKLKAAGIIVAPTNADATAWALAAVHPSE